MRIALALTLVAPLLAGCDLFSTRTPSAAEGGDSVWLTPVSPQTIVENLRASFQAGNFGDYERTMTEDFVFVPDESDVFDIELVRPGEEVFAGWNKQVETSTAEVIFGSVAELRVERLRPTAMVLGLFEDWAGALGEVTLARGDTLVLATDGILEVPGTSGEEFGEARLLAAATRHRRLPLDSLIRAIARDVRRFGGSAADDQTLVVGRARPGRPDRSGGAA